MKFLETASSFPSLFECFSRQQVAYIYSTCFEHTTAHVLNMTQTTGFKVIQLKPSGLLCWKLFLFAFSSTYHTQCSLIPLSFVLIMPTSLQTVPEVPVIGRRNFPTTFPQPHILRVRNPLIPKRYLVTLNWHH